MKKRKMNNTIDNPKTKVFKNNNNINTEYDLSNFTEATHNKEYLIKLAKIVAIGGTGFNTIEYVNWNDFIYKHEQRLKIINTIDPITQLPFNITNENFNNSEDWKDYPYSNNFRKLMIFKVKHNNNIQYYYADSMFNIILRNLNNPFDNLPWEERILDKVKLNLKPFIDNSNNLLNQIYNPKIQFNGICSDCNIELTFIQCQLVPDIYSVYVLCNNNLYQLCNIINIDDDIDALCRLKLTLLWRSNLLYIKQIIDDIPENKNINNSTNLQDENELSTMERIYNHTQNLNTICLNEQVNNLICNLTYYLNNIYETIDDNLLLTNLDVLALSCQFYSLAIPNRIMNEAIDNIFKCFDIHSEHIF